MWCHSDDIIIPLNDRDVVSTLNPQWNQAVKYYENIYLFFTIIIIIFFWSVAYCTSFVTNDVFDGVVSKFVSVYKYIAKLKPWICIYKWHLSQNKPSILNELLSLSANQKRQGGRDGTMNPSPAFRGAETGICSNQKCFPHWVLSQWRHRRVKSCIVFRLIDLKKNLLLFCMHESNFFLHALEKK